MAIEAELLATLPWAHPFRMVDRVVECLPHRRIVTLKRVSAADALFEGAERGAGGSFPSALVIEGLSQSAALLFRVSYGAAALTGLPLLGHLRATLRGGAEAGDTLKFEVTAVKMTSRGGIFAGAARVDGVAIVESELGFGVASR